MDVGLIITFQRKLNRSAVIGRQLFLFVYYVGESKHVPTGVSQAN
jgi:hypothetical protein